MNLALQQRSDEIHLADNAHRALRYAFSLACANRVRHLIEQPRVLELLDLLQCYVAGTVNEATLVQAADEAAHLANHHRGSTSIDGTQHSAVSAAYAVANALAGRALDAADYAAYSIVYGYGVYAVSDTESFAPEQAWQMAELNKLVLVTAAA